MLYWENMEIGVDSSQSMNKNEAYVPVEIKDKSICINKDIGEIIIDMM